MTVESFVATPQYVVDGVGPYTITHPYKDASDITAEVYDAETRVPLLAADFAVAPVSSLTNGSLTLTAAAAAAHAGKSLSIERDTAMEQGWASTRGGREEGLERQMDRTIMVSQDQQQLLRRVPRVPNGSMVNPPKLPVPVAGVVPIGNDAGTGWKSGPSADDIAEAQQNAVAATAAAVSTATDVILTEGFRDEAEAFAAAAEAQITNADTLGNQPPSFYLPADHLSLHDLGYVMGAPTIYDTAGSATYTTPADAKALLIEVLGAGGGGGGADDQNVTARAGGGGGAGSYCKHLETSPLDASYAVSVGAGGAGGSRTTSGSPGGDTSLGALLTAEGGRGGINSGLSTQTAVIVGRESRSAIPATGNIARIAGECGNNGIKVSDSRRASGAGAMSFFGTGGSSKIASSSSEFTVGEDAVGNGAGGSGGLGSTTTSAAGGNGAPGLVIITPLF